MWREKKHILQQIALSSLKFCLPNELYTAVVLNLLFFFYTLNLFFAFFLFRSLVTFRMSVYDVMWSTVVYCFDRLIMWLQSDRTYYEFFYIVPRKYVILKKKCCWYCYSYNYCCYCYRFAASPFATMDCTH